MRDKVLLQELETYIQFYLKSAEAVVQFSIKEPVRRIVNESPIELESELAPLQSYIKKNRGHSFKETLFKLIDSKGTTDTAIYHKAGIDRKHFSKIRSNHDYRPGKRAVIALAFALELVTHDFYHLLGSAGYSLSKSETFDLIVQFFLEKKNYDHNSIDQALEYFSLQPLFSVLK